MTELAPENQNNHELEAVEIGDPTYECPHCRFLSSLSGTWSWVDGRLVFTADVDEQPGRGPTRFWCGEGDGCGELSGDIRISHDKILTGGPPEADAND